MIEGHFDITPENPYTGDPSLPHFKFTQSEKDEMLDRGMTESEITAKEAEISARQARAKLEQEMQSQDKAA